MKLDEFGVGKITAQNTTKDVKPGETQRQAAKFGNKIGKDGKPPLLHKKAAKNSDPNTLMNLGISEDYNPYSVFVPDYKPMTPAEKAEMDKRISAIVARNKKLPPPASGPDNPAWRQWSKTDKDGYTTRSGDQLNRRVITDPEGNLVAKKTYDTPGGATAQQNYADSKLGKAGTTDYEYSGAGMNVKKTVDTKTGKTISKTAKFSMPNKDDNYNSWKTYTRTVQGESVDSLPLAERSILDQVLQAIAPKIKPQQYEKAAQALHDVLVRKSREGQLRHTLGYYAQRVGRAYAGIDYRALADYYADTYGTEGITELKIQKPDEKDTLGIERKYMPQIKTTDYPEFIEYLEKNGARFRSETIPAADLKAMQKEFSDAGILKQLEKNLRDGPNTKAVIASSDDYILDGHHRWLVALNTGADLNVYRVNMPAWKLYDLVNDFEKTYYKDIYDEGAPSIGVPMASGLVVSIFPHRPLKIKKSTPGKLNYDESAVQDEPSPEEKRSQELRYNRWKLEHLKRDLQQMKHEYKHRYPKMNQDPPGGIWMDREEYEKRKQRFRKSVDDPDAPFALTMREDITQADIDQLEVFADKLFAKVGIDVEFTRHFLDRVNDERNKKPITMAELTRLFKQEFKRWGKPIAQMGPDAEAVMKDLQTDINLPFVLQYDRANNELDLVAKTVMRKKDFKTPDREFAVEDSQPNTIGGMINFPGYENKPKEKDKKPKYPKVKGKDKSILDKIKGWFTTEELDEDLRDWFKEKWVNIGKKNKDGSHPECGTSGKKKGYAKCVPAAKAKRMSKKEKASATRRKRAAQNKAGRGGKDKPGSGKKPIRVSTKAEGINEIKMEVIPKDNTTKYDFDELIGQTKKIATFKGYDLHFAEDNLSHHYLIKDPNDEGFLGNLTLKKYSNYWQSEVWFDPEIQGKGFGLPLYVYVIKKGYTLVSDSIQSIGSREGIWKKLTQVPGIHVYAWNQKYNEFFSWNPEEEEDGAVYWDPDEISRLEQKYKDGEMSYDDFEKAKSSLGREHAYQGVRLVATLEKVDEGINNEIEITEVSQTPSAIRAWADSDAAKNMVAGFEAEVVLSNMPVLGYGGPGDDDEDEDEEEYLCYSNNDNDENLSYEYDQPTSDISSAVGFFNDNDFTAVGLDYPDDIQRLRDGLNDEYEKAWEENDAADDDDYIENYSEEDFMKQYYPMMSDVFKAYFQTQMPWPYGSEPTLGTGDKETDPAWKEFSEELKNVVNKDVKISTKYGSMNRGDYYILEPDGSIIPDGNDDAGVEIISPPMPMTQAHQNLQDLMKFLKSKGAYTNEKTGLHMGISMPGVAMTRGTLTKKNNKLLDYVKLVLFTGDTYMLEKFDRRFNEYAKSAFDRLQYNIVNPQFGEDNFSIGKVMNQLSQGLDQEAASLIQEYTGFDKYTSLHIKEGYIEFRIAGGDYLNRFEDAELAMLRFARAFTIAADPNAERKEYLKKLYKLASSENAVENLWARYQAGEIDLSALKGEWSDLVLRKQKSTADMRKSKVAKKLAKQERLFTFTIEKPSVVKLPGLRESIMRVVLREEETVTISVPATDIESARKKLPYYADWISKERANAAEYQVSAMPQERPREPEYTPKVFAFSFQLENNDKETYALTVRAENRTIAAGALLKYVRTDAREINPDFKGAYWIKNLKDIDPKDVGKYTKIDQAEQKEKQSYNVEVVYKRPNGSIIAPAESTIASSPREAIEKILKSHKALLYKKDTVLSASVVDGKTRIYRVAADLTSNTTGETIKFETDVKASTVNDAIEAIKPIIKREHPDVPVGYNTKSVKVTSVSIVMIGESWSAKYKRSINCDNPKGFSQKAHCAGRKKTESIVESFVKPQFDVEWDEAARYPEFVKIGKEAWIKLASKGKAVEITDASDINNTEAADPDAFSTLDKAKQKRALAQLERGVVEMPIVAVYSDGYKELIAGNTRLTAMMAKNGKATVWQFEVPDEVATLAEASVEEQGSTQRLTVEPHMRGLENPYQKQNKKELKVFTQAYKDMYDRARAAQDKANTTGGPGASYQTPVMKAKFDPQVLPTRTTPKKPRVVEDAQVDEGVNDPHIFKAVFLAGGPGSGKSFVANNLLGGTGLRTVNSDDVYEYLMAKQGLELDPDTIASPQGQEIRDRAKTLTDNRMHTYLKGRIGLVIDGTGKDVTKYQKQVEKLGALGYDCMMIFVNTSEDVAQQRNSERKRSLPANMVTDLWNTVQNNLMKFQQVFGASRFHIVDNSGGLEDLDRKENFDKVYNETQRFLNTPPNRRAAQRWIQQQQKAQTDATQRQQQQTTSSDGGTENNN